MTEQTQPQVQPDAQQSQPAAPQNIPSQYSAADLMKIKDALKEKADGIYTNFLREFLAIPHLRPLSMIAIQHLDTGYLWFLRAIEKHELKLEAAKQEAPQQESDGA